MGSPILSDVLMDALNEISIDETFEIVRSNMDGLISLANVGAARRPSEGHKFDWMEMRVNPTASALTSAVNDTVTTIPVTSGSLFRVGMQVSAKNSDEVMLVTAVTNNNLTVTRGFGDTTAVAIDNGVELFVNSTAREENSTIALDGIVQPGRVENFFQIMDTGLTFSRNALATLQYGDTNDLTFQLAERMRQLMIQVNRALISGRKTETTIGNDTYWTSGGFKYWNDQAGRLKTDAGGAALTLDRLNDTTAEIVKRGGSVDTIVVGVDRARQINSLVSAQYNSQRLADFISDEGAVRSLPSDLPLVGNVTNVVLDTNVNDDEVLLLDSSRLSIIPMGSGNADADGNWRTLDATQPGQDGASARIVGDWGFEFRDSQTHMARIHGLSTS